MSADDDAKAVAAMLRVPRNGVVLPKAHISEVADYIVGALEITEEHALHGMGVDLLVGAVRAATGIEEADPRLIMYANWVRPASPTELDKLAFAAAASALKKGKGKAKSAVGKGAETEDDSDSDDDDGASVVSFVAGKDASAKREENKKRDQRVTGMTPIQIQAFDAVRQR